MPGVPDLDRMATSGRIGVPAPEAGQVQTGRTGGSPRPVVLAAVVVAFLAVAAIKPWDAPTGPDPGAGLPAPSGAVATPVSATPAGDPTPRTRTPDPTPRGASFGEPGSVPELPDPAALAAATLPREEWGVRAIVFEPAAGRERVDEDARLVERWIRAEVESPRRARTIHAPAVFAGDAVVAFGLTAPPGTRPIDVRVWRLFDLELPQRVVVEEVAGPGPFGVLWRPGPAATALGTWARGAYRFEVVLADRVVRIVTGVPTGARMVSRLPPLPMGPFPDLDTAVRGMPAGLFVVSGPEIVPVTAQPGTPMDELAAWLAPPCSQPPAACPVGRVVSRTTSAIGLVLAPGDVPDIASLELVAPVSRAVRVLTEVYATGSGGDTGTRPVLVLRVDSPGPLSSGLYRLTVAWRTAAGQERAASWHVEIVPPGL